MSEMTDMARDRMVTDVKALMGDVEELLKLTAGDASGKMSDVRARLGERIATARAGLADAEREFVEKTRQAARNTDAYVHEHPWQSLGIAAGAAFLVGLLVGRR